MYFNSKGVTAFVTVISEILFVNNGTNSACGKKQYFDTGPC